MNQRIVIQYNPITKDLEIVENEFSTFEAFGILEAAKQMIANGWLNET
jgi:hypothetical protein